MQKWEYTWIFVPHNLGKMKVNKEKIAAHAYVNQLGEQGWELVGIEQGFPGSGISDYILFFKRPKA